MRIHGRGGQGVVTAAELLSVAAFVEGRHAQAFPSFGSERTGAPVVAFCRIADRAIRTREPVAEPDALIVQDPTLLHQVDVFGGLRPGRLRADQHARAASSELGLGELAGRSSAERLLTVPASELAREQHRPAASERAAARRLRRADRRGLDRLGRRRDPASASADVADGQLRRGAHRVRRACAPSSGSRHMLRQIEGSLAVAETVAMCRPEVICAYPISPQTHIVEGLSQMVKAGELAPCEFINVESEFAAMSVAIGASARRRAHLHGDRQPGAALHGRGALQRVGPGAADRDDGRQPRHRRADQHLERPQRRDVAARLRLDPALRRDQPGGARPAHSGFPARRGALAAGDGLHGRLHPHPRLRARRHARRRSRSTPSCRRSSRARCSTPRTR